MSNLPIPPLSTLSERQQDVVEAMVVTGGTDYEIGAKLGISKFAVSKLLRLCEKRLELKGRVHLTRWACRVGLA